MKQSFFQQLAADWRLGELTAEPQPVTGGHMHRMYRLDTSCGSYALKLLNPEIMKRPEAMDNYRRAEALECVLERNQLPIVAAMPREGAKMQCLDGRYYYLFPWVDNAVLHWNEIRAEHCAIIGELLARLHSLELPAGDASAKPAQPEQFAWDWAALADGAWAACPELAQSLAGHLPLLEQAQNAYNRAVEALPPLCSICNADMDSKNVLWQDGQPLVIDLECLEIGNPVNDLMVLSLSWSGDVLCQIDFDRLRAFLSAYQQTAKLPPLDWHSLAGLGFSWLSWLHYNLRRACGEEAVEEAERQTGLHHARETLERIRYYATVQEQVSACIAAAMA